MIENWFQVFAAKNDYPQQLNKQMKSKFLSTYTLRWHLNDAKWSITIINEEYKKKLKC